MKNLWILFLLLMMACSSSTSIVSSWKEPGANTQNTKFSKILAVVMASTESARRQAEDELARENPIFVPSYQVLNSKEVSMDKEKSGDILKDQNIDGVLILKLVDKEKTQNYVPGSYTGGYYGRYSYYWGGYYDPGYYQENTNYLIEVSLYSLEKNELVWSGISSTVNPSSVEKTVKNILNESYKQMRVDGFLPPAN
ncbi:hypothetical protein [Echinicola salinicaeni]|uniref:hypothetical protein n=1 Tax=Echinicola salinicaeni TaxID=2762757 RepID=UPI0016479C7D|nr:hypothetical protein [Echinicola salinicaeni]